MDKRSYSNGLDLPLGLSMAMAQNPLAMSYFTNLTAEQKEMLIGRVHNINSKREMQELVQDMANNAVEPHIGGYMSDMSDRYTM